MKRCLALLCCFLLLLPSAALARARYANLTDAPTQEEVAARLRAAGVPEDSVETFFALADDFNALMAPVFAFQDGWRPLPEAGCVDYGEYYPMSKKWYGNKEYEDILCRIGAFLLLKDRIAVGETLDEADWDDAQTIFPQDGYDYAPEDVEWGGFLETDRAGLNTNPFVKWDRETMAAYFTLFDPIELSAEPAPGEMIELARKKWADVDFGAETASLVAVWGYDALAQCVAVSHAAVLIDDAQGLLLVEKTNPQAPYQATQFETRAEVKEYLLTTLAADDARYDMASPPRIVTENGAEMGA